MGQRMLSLTALCLVLTQTAEIAAKPPRTYQPLGKISAVIDSTVVAGADLEVHAIPYMMVEAELGAGRRLVDSLGFAARAGPSGLFITLRNDNGEGFTMRGALITGVALGAYGSPDPHFSLQARIDATLWFRDHFGLSLGLVGGIVTTGSERFPLLPDFGFGAGLTF